MKFGRNYSRLELLKGRHLLRKNKQYVALTVGRAWDFPWLRDISTSQNILDLSARGVIDVTSETWKKFVTKENDD